MSKERIIRRSVADLENLRGKTDWAQVAALTDEEIEAAMRDDPDWADLIDMDWSDAVVVVPVPKKAISIRLDAEVIDFFKSQGPGYQTRINAVLRRFMEKARKPDAAE
jgi:uncharacterized protein (DUF4415 family)